MNIVNRFLSLALLMALLVGGAFGQATTTTTTLSAAVGLSDGNLTVASATGISGLGTSNAPQTLLFVDRELMLVTAVSGTYVTVRRGHEGTPVATHASGAKVWVGPPSYFSVGDPSGSCTSTAQPNLPRPATSTGNVWDCPTSGPNAGLWVVYQYRLPTNFTDGYYFVPPSACTSSVATTAYASGWPIQTRNALGRPVYEVKTDTTAGTISVVCTIGPPSRLTAGKGVTVLDVTLLYGVQTTALSSIAAATIKTVTFPTPTAGGASAAATVADGGGTLTAIPTSLQTSTTTTGLMYAEKVSLGTPKAINTDYQELTFDQVFTTAGSTATILQIGGLIVHYNTSPL